VKISVITWIGIYVMVWFIVLMPIINTGVQNHAEADIKPSYGDDVSSPIKHGMKKKLILTSSIAFGIWLMLLVAFYITMYQEMKSPI
jgi:predicted secreted protein